MQAEITHSAVTETAVGPKRSLGLYSATTLVIGSMIGSGIFIVAADIGRIVDSPALFIAAWLVTSIMTIIGALSAMANLQQ
jgi:hypothetical protein